MALHCNKWLSSHFFNWFSVSWCHLLVQMCFGTYLAVWTTAEMAGCPNWPSPHKSLWESQEKRVSNNHLLVKLSFLLVPWSIHWLKTRTAHISRGDVRVAVAFNSDGRRWWWCWWNPLVAGWNLASPPPLLRVLASANFCNQKSNYVAFPSE